MKQNDFLNMETAEANIELNKIMNEDNKIIYKKGASSTAEANIAIQEDFYSENSLDEELSNNIINNTPVIKIIGKEK